MSSKINSSGMSPDASSSTPPNTPPGTPPSGSSTLRNIPATPHRVGKAASQAIRSGLQGLTSAFSERGNEEMLRTPPYSRTQGISVSSSSGERREMTLLMSPERKVEDKIVPSTPVKRDRKVSDTIRRTPRQVLYPHLQEARPVLPEGRNEEMEYKIPRLIPTTLAKRARSGASSLLEPPSKKKLESKDNTGMFSKPVKRVDGDSRNSYLNTSDKVEATFSQALYSDLQKLTSDFSEKGNEEMLRTPPHSPPYSRTQGILASSSSGEKREMMSPERRAEDKIIPSIPSTPMKTRTDNSFKRTLEINFNNSDDSYSYTKAKNFGNNSMIWCCRELKKYFGADANLDLVELGSGNFMTAYRLCIKHEKGVQVPLNTVVKFFHFNKTCLPNEFNENITNEIINYFWMKELKFPVIDHYNLDKLIERNYSLKSHLCKWMELEKTKGVSEEALLELKKTSKEIKKIVKDEFSGFYQVPYIESPFLNREQLTQLNLEMERNPNIIQTLKEDKHPIYQLQQIFQQAWENRIPIDLKMDNLRIKDDGTVLLCDLLYDLEADSENGFSDLVQGILEKFAKKGSALWKYLDPRPTVVSE